MTIKTAFFIALIICLFQYPIIADSLQIISQEIDGSDITVGDEVIYTITVISDEGVPLSVAPLTAKSEHLEIGLPKINTIYKFRLDQDLEKYTDFFFLDSKGLSLGKEDPLKVIKEIVYQVFPFEPGENEIPPVSITCDSQTIKSKIMRFEVQSVLPNDAKEIKDIKRPIDMPKNWLAYSILGAVILTVFGLSLYFVKRHSSSRESSISQELSLLPHEIAYKKLAQVQITNLVDKGLMKEYYSRVSQIIRAYIGERYGIKALESTSYELLQEPKVQTLSKSVREILREFLRAGDLVKFAKYTPDKEEAYEFLEQARKFIDETSAEHNLENV